MGRYDGESRKFDIGYNPPFCSSAPIFTEAKSEFLRHLGILIEVHLNAQHSDEDPEYFISFICFCVSFMHFPPVYAYFNSFTGRLKFGGMAGDTIRAPITEDQLSLSTSATQPYPMTSFLGSQLCYHNMRTAAQRMTLSLSLRRCSRSI